VLNFGTTEYCRPLMTARMRSRLSSLLRALWTKFRVICKPARAVNITKNREIKNVKISLRNHQSFLTSVEYAVFFFFFSNSFGLASSSISMINVESEQVGRKKYSLYFYVGDFEKKSVNSRISKLFITYCMKYNPCT
jgi:hypothetical protein